MTGTCIGVIGGSGGVGASLLAAAVAAAVSSSSAAAGLSGPALLVDLDPMGGGIDVLLGIEHVPGARWSDLKLGGGHLDPDQLTERLPRWRDVAVLAADVAPPSALAVRQVLCAARELGAVTVLDLPRAPAPARDAVAAQLPMVVLLAAAEVAALAAARAVVGSLPAAATGAVLRRGSVPPPEAAGFLGVPLLGALPARRGRLPDGPSRRLRRLGAALLDGARGALLGEDLAGQPVQPGRPAAQPGRPARPADAAARR